MVKPLNERLDEINRLRNRLQHSRSWSIPFDTEFTKVYTYHSVKIEGSPLSFDQVDSILSNRPDPTLANIHPIYIHEVIDHKEAFDHIKDMVKQHQSLDEASIKTIHYLLMQDIQVGGVYRDQDVYINDALVQPPSPFVMYDQLKWFYHELSTKAFDGDIHKAAWIHAEFVRIHPFTDGNGRCARLLMNHQLMSHGYLSIYIDSDDQDHYYDALQRYTCFDQLDDLIDMIINQQIVGLNHALSLV